MTITLTAPLTEPTITEDIRERVVAIIAEQNQVILERGEVIQGIWTARIAQQHGLMVGPGGTGKSFLARDTSDRIDGSTYFETAFDETTDPAQVFGPPDISAMIGDPANGIPGRMRRVPDGMLPEATDAFLDEFFNANGPLLHSVMPIANERVWHNNGHPTPVPLRQILAGTNKLNADVDLAALWDRLHQRWIVDYVRSRTSLVTMAAHNMARMAEGMAGGSSRGVNTAIGGATRTTVTLDELDIAHAEALSLDFSPAVLELALDLKEELQQGEAKVTISDRRWNEGLVAVASRAWLRGHKTVTTGDLDVLASMWWTLQDQMPVARKVILGATNPGEKVAHELLDDLDQAEKEYRTIADPNEDDNKRRKVGISVVGTAEKIIKKAGEERTKAEAAGSDTSKLDEVIQRAHTFNVKVGTEVFGLDANSMVNQAGAQAVANTTP